MDIEVIGNVTPPSPEEAKRRAAVFMQGLTQVIPGYGYVLLLTSLNQSGSERRGSICSNLSQDQALLLMRSVLKGAGGPAT